MSFETDKIEFYIVQSLLKSDVYLRNYASKINSDLFSEKLKNVVKGVLLFYKKNGKAPPTTLLEDVILPKICKDSDLDAAKESLDVSLSIDVPVEDIKKFMDDETRKFIKNRTIMNAFVKCVDLLEQQDHDKIVAIMESAFRLDFDDSMGLDYFEDLELRQERCDQISETISTGLPTLDRLIGGGYRRKSLFVFAGPANVGKSLVLNDAASSLALAGYNVLYLTLELSEDYISQRTDAKFADVSMNLINVSPAEAIKKAIARREVMKSEGKKLGKLIYKEYAPNSISCNDVRGLLKTLELKKEFNPDFIIVDYLKLLKPSGKLLADNMYGKLGAVCEELRALAMEYNCCILSASQTGRQSYNSSSIGMEDVADSIAISQTADVLITLIRTAATNAENIMKLSLAKSRFSKNEGSFDATIDYDHMRLVDTQQGQAVIKNPSLSAKKVINRKIEDFDDEIKPVQKVTIANEDKFKESDGTERARTVNI